MDSAGDQLVAITLDKIRRAVQDPRYASKVLMQRFAWRQGLGRVPFGPTVLNIETTNRCNLHCTMCQREFGETKKILQANNGLMGLETYRKILPFFPGAKRIALSGFGETFLHPEFAEMLRLAKEHSPAHTTVYTNGTVLNEKKAEAVVRLGLDCLSNSIDGASKEIFEPIRGISFDHLVKNLKMLQRIKSELGSEKPEVVLQMVAMKQNLGDLPKLVELAHEVGAAEVSIVHLTVHADHLREQSLYLHQAEAERVFTRAREVAERLGVRLTLPSFEDHVANLRCFLTDLFVTWDGVVLSCPLERHTLGSLQEQPIQRIWNNAQMAHLRKRMCEEGIGCVCSGCPYNEVTREVHLAPFDVGSTRRRLDQSAAATQ